MKPEYLIKKICPICSQKVEQSDYLNQIFNDKPEVNYLAHLITHYRHNHISSWDKCWGRHGGRYRGHWFGDYEEEKIKVNERAKRQIIRKGSKTLIELGIKTQHFMELQNTDPKTIELANKLLGYSFNIEET